MLQNVQLWYLMQIEHYQSLSLAAEKLHVSQPAISAAIKRLENQLGVKLTERTYKGLSLTPEGKQVVELAKKAFVHLDEIEAMFQKPKEGNELFLLDDIIIYTNPSYAPIFMSALSEKYANQNTVNTLQIFNTQPGSDLNKLIATSSNTVILTILTEDYPLPSNISCTVLRKSKAYIACMPEFPYFTPEQTSVSLKELQHVPLIISSVAFEFQSTLLSLIEQYCEPNIKMIAPDANSVFSTVRAGKVAAFYNRFFHEIQFQGLRALPIQNAPIFNLCLLYGKNTSPAVIAQLTELIEPTLI